MKNARTRNIKIKGTPYDPVPKSASQTLESVMGKEYSQLEQPMPFQANVDHSVERGKRWDATPVAAKIQSLEDVWGDNPRADAIESIEKLNEAFLSKFHQNEIDVVKRFLHIANPLLKSNQPFGVETIFPLLAVWQLEPLQVQEIFNRWTAFLIKGGKLKKSETVYDTACYIRV